MNDRWKVEEVPDSNFGRIVLLNIEGCTLYRVTDLCGVPADPAALREAIGRLISGGSKGKRVLRRAPHPIGESWRHKNEEADPSDPHFKPMAVVEKTREGLRMSDGCTWTVRELYSNGWRPEEPSTRRKGSSARRKGPRTKKKVEGRMSAESGRD